MDEQVNQPENSGSQTDEYFTNKKKEPLGAKLKASMEKNPLFAGKNKFISLAVVLVLVVGGIVAAVVLSNTNRDETPDVSEPAPEEDPVRAAIARRKAELAEAIESITTPEEAAPIIAELEELMNQLTEGENARSEFFHSDQRDLMILKGQALINSHQITLAIEVYRDMILFEGENRNHSTMLYVLLASAYRRLGEEGDFEQFRALNLALDNVEFADPEIPDIEVSVIQSFIVLLERRHGWGDGLLSS